MTGTITEFKQQVKTPLEVLYRKSIDADQLAAQLKQNGTGKFAAILSADSGFTTTSNQFKPYIMELLAEVDNLDSVDKIAPLLEKMETITQVMGQFIAVNQTGKQ